MVSDAATYWLLDSVHEHRHLIRYLLPDVSGDEWHFGLVFNRRDHGLTRPELTDALVSLVQANQLLAWPARTDLFAVSRQGFQPTRRQIESNLKVSYSTEASVDPSRPRGGLWYGLSPAGGTYWEELTHPDWSRYMETEEWESALSQQNVVPAPERRWVRLTTFHRSLLETYLRRDEEMGAVDPSTITWDVVRPWDATYWKRFESGHRLNYSLWPETELARRGAAVKSYGDWDAAGGISRPDWYTDYLTGEPRQ